MAEGVTSCQSCGAEIIFAWTRNRRPMPLNAPGAAVPVALEPDENDRLPSAGGDIDPRNVAAYRDPAGRWWARVLKRGEEPLGYERRFMPHFATCPSADAHRKRRQRKNEARHTRHTRQPGGRRPVPTPTLFTD